MRRFVALTACAIILGGCSSNVRFIQTDETYVIREKPDGARIVFRHDRLKRPHRVIGIIEGYVDAKARRPQLDALLITKARAIGADGIMLIEYDVDHEIYIEHHHAIIGSGPWRRHVGARRRRATTQKSATAIAIVFR